MLAFVLAQIQNLINIGARKFLVINVPDVGSIPETRLIATLTQNSRLTHRTTRYTKRFNRLLKKQLKRLERTHDIEVVRFDQFDEFEDLLDDAVEFGFTNSTDACFSTVNFTFNPDCNFGQSFDQFVFFDEIHPTARVNQLISKELIEEVGEFEDEDEDENEEDDEDE